MGLNGTQKEQHGGRGGFVPRNRVVGGHMQGAGGAAGRCAIAGLGGKVTGSGSSSGAWAGKQRGCNRDA